MRSRAFPRPGAAGAGCRRRVPAHRGRGGAPRALGGLRRPPDAASVDKLAALLTYGERLAARPKAANGVVMPRLGTVSPWASKATDIARNCGLALHRVERVVEYRLALKKRLLGAPGRCRPTSARRWRAAARPHDRERGLRARGCARHLFDPQPAPPLAHVDVLGQRPRGAGGGGQRRVRPGAGRRRDRLPGRRLQAACSATPATSS
jgi:hypothetical protein